MRTGRTLLALIALLTLSLTGPGSDGPAAAQEPSGTARYDVVFQDGRVLDGTGTPWFRADVAVAGDTIAAVGEVDASRAETVIDASGLYLAPGFIDPHTHAPGSMDDPDLSAARPILAQGLTTLTGNPDGGGAVDLAEQREELLADGLGVNVAPFIGHGSVREEVVGMDDRAPTASEMDRMRELVDRAMQEGAFGLTSGLFYTPGSYAETEEVVRLAEVASRHGGLYKSHIRDESTYSVGVVAAVDEVIEVAREADLPGVVTHIKVLGPHVWGYSAALVHRIERARSQGVEVWADQYPYTASATGLGSALIPRWAQAGGQDSLVARLDRPATRDSIAAGIVTNLDRRGGADRLQFRRYEENPAIEGRTLAEVADSVGVGPVEMTMRLVRTGYVGVVSYNMTEKDVRRLMRQPWTMTSSDGCLVPRGEGVPHPRCYGAHPQKIRKYVVEEDVLPLSQAIRSMTGTPARLLGLEERGRVEVGRVADLAVFDLDRLRSPATFTDPHHLAEGMVHVLVGGRFAIRDGEFTGVRAGRVLRLDGPPAPRTVAEAVEAGR
ncbi:MAG: amidohydrolase family protein [Candidatus Palauibacterales bacterium]|nr:amidohydrolase family protein [Candidatus Palauibacterales bacterium]